MGTVDEDGDELEVTAFPLSVGEICIGVRAHGVALLDSCGAPDAWWVTLVGTTLYVTGTRVHEGDVVVHTTVGDHTVPAFPAHGAYAFVARIASDADVIGVDNGARIDDCPYRQVIGALIASGATAAVPHFPVRIKVCTSEAAGAELGGTSASIQGAGAVLKRIADGFVLLDLGGAVCDPGVLTPEQAAQQAETTAACASLGWGPASGWAA